MYMLRVTYRVKFHNVIPFEQLFQEDLLPLALRHGFKLLGMWRTVVGRAGEYMELWQFESMADFEDSWSRFLQDPGLQAIFERSGPMVEDEVFSVLQPLDTLHAPPAETFRV